MCDCIEKANEVLAEHNARIDTRESMNMKTGGVRDVLLVPLTKINNKSRKPLPPMYMNYCPLCGEKAKP